ncbi:MAG: DUF3267 domain-containing protein [Saprospiraceae bacterium]
MNIQVSELEKNGFTLQDQLEHHELAPFVRIYLKKRTAYNVFYFAFNLLALLACFPLLGIYKRTGDVEPGDAITHFCYGIALSFLLIPLHEFIHVLAYRSQGAANTSYDVNWKKFYFMAVADKFVASRQEFTVVALAPFVVISTAAILLMPVVGPVWQFTLLGILFNHTACCAGDFSLLSYFSFHKDRQVVTYDDVANKVSYFYVKNEETA